MHLFAQFGRKVNPMVHQQVLGQRLREVALVPKQFAEESAGQFGGWAPIIDVARREAEREQLSLVIDDQVQLEAVEPVDGGLASCRTFGKDAVLVAARV